ncbi:hypothetical protein SASPL_115787 [Salvia splendens]|uniref:Uncharacterized protein n=1 Tax=Salvia splendens TaxID=180675 RepID=A0A8X9A0M1_SALSN|nr:hypothetical protein SASPL_115787 [Salvia splendens]
MGTETLKLPVIDFSNLEHKNGTWEPVKIPVKQALEGKNLQSYTEKLSKFDHIELEKYIEDHIKSSTFVVRVQKYDNPPKHETQTGLVAHTDKNILTIVQQLNHITSHRRIGDSLTKDGQKWHGHCPIHRVMMRGDEARYSIALFSTMKEGSIVKAPEELVDEDHPLLYKPYDYHKFMEFYLSYDAALTSPNPLNDYCGV